MSGMSRCWWHCSWKLVLASSVMVGGAIASSGNCALAQITPDGTLPNNSIVTPQSNTSVIEGGTQAGGNLFHSFEQFSVPTRGAAYFNNTLNIQNIFSRVTGESISNIDGLLRANGTANLFLLNPNGIIFGPNASLNIGGSFVGSTASAVNFADGTQFSATAVQTKPLLTVSVPLGLQFGNNAGKIQVQGNGQGLRATSNLIDTTVGLRVQPDRTLALVGSDVTLSGGTLKTAGGRIELGSVAGSGLVSLNPIDFGLALGYSGVPIFGEIQLSGGAAVDASGSGGGDIQVRGRRVTLTDGSQIEASTLGAEQGGNLNVTAKESVELIGSSANGNFLSGLFTLVYPGATGSGGNLTIETGQLIRRYGAQVDVSSLGQGPAGKLTIIKTPITNVEGQIIPDETLPIRSTVSNTGIIEGGTQAGSNLFHSFEQFSVPTGSAAYFNNALDIKNIFSRVTGESISNIDGKLRANASANLFLLNPNGIIFGPNATLAIGGSFLGSTASSLNFADGTQFSATNPQSPPLLTVSVPVGLQFDPTPGEIIVQTHPQALGAVAATEAGDAGQLSSTAQSIDTQPAGTGLSSISGTLSDVNDVDLFQIFLTGDKTFSATTVGQSNFDTQLFLFYGGGFGVYSNDDSSGTLQSTLPANDWLTLPGLYYLAISSRDNDPQSSLGYIFNKYYGYRTTPGSEAPLSNWNNDGRASGTYKINLTGAEFTTSTEGSKLKVQPGRTLALVGGKVTLDGAALKVPRGRVELGGVAGSETVGLSIDGNNLGLNFPDNVARTDVSFTNQALVDVTAGGGGSIAINARNLDILGGSSLSAGIGQGLGAVGSQAGDITLNATGVTTIRQRFSRINNYVGNGAIGNAGDINIKAGSLLLTDSARLVTSTYGEGNAGSISVQASGDVSLSGIIDSSTNGEGDAGSVSVQANGDVSLRGIIQSLVSSKGEGNAGSISVQANGDVSITDYGIINSSTYGEGDAGSVSVQANGNVSFVNDGSINSFSWGEGDAANVSVQANGDVSFADGGIFTSTNLQGKGGDINIQALSVSVTEGAQLQARTQGSGNAGNIQIVATDSVTLSGFGISRYSGLFTDTDGYAPGQGGNIIVQTGALRILDGAVLSARTGTDSNGGNITANVNTLEITGGGQMLTTAFSSGDAGRITVNARDSITVAGSDPAYFDRLAKFDQVTIAPASPVSGLFANTDSGSRGQGGSLRIETGRLNVRDGAYVNVSSTGAGAAGDLTVSADSIRLDNQSSIQATTATGNQGNITLRSGDLVLRRESFITTNATGTATGGNITIDTDILAALENSDITANAVENFGGQVIIDAQGIFGTEFRERENPATSDITATSELGPEFSGTVEINTPDVDPSQGLVNLPTVPIETEVVQACQPGGSEQQSEFIITGRGGLPPNPTDFLNTDAVWIDLDSTTQIAENRPSSEEATHQTLPTSGQLVEATGWTLNDKGEVVLIASAPTATPHSSGLTQALCHIPSPFKVSD